MKVEVDIHREQLHQLGELLQTIAENPEPVQEDFEAELDRVEVKVSALLEQVETSIGGGKAMKEQLEDMVTGLEEARRLSQEAEAILDEAVVRQYSAFLQLYQPNPNHKSKKVQYIPLMSRFTHHFIGGWRGCATKTENCLGRDKTSAGDVFIAIKIVLITIHWVQLAFDLAYSPFQVTLGRAQQQLEVDAKEALRLAQVPSL